MSLSLLIMLRTFFCIVFSLSFVVSLAQTKAPVRHCDKSEQWVPVKPPLPPGAEAELLEGDPKHEGLFTMRLRLPPGYVLAPHTHPADERVTVISGQVFVGIGDSMDQSKEQAFSAGCFYVNPAGLHHYVYSGKEGAVLQLNCMAPWGIHFLGESKK